VVLRRPRKTCRHRDCRSESLVDLWCSSTANSPAHIVESAIQGAFPDPPALSADMFSTMPTGFRSFTHADRVVHSVFRSAGRGPDRRSQVEFQSGRILTTVRRVRLRGAKPPRSAVLSCFPSSTNDIARIGQGRARSTRWTRDIGPTRAHDISRLVPEYIPSFRASNLGQYVSVFGQIPYAFCPNSLCLFPKFSLLCTIMSRHAD